MLFANDQSGGQLGTATTTWSFVDDLQPACSLLTSVKDVLPIEY